MTEEPGRLPMIQMEGLGLTQGGGLGPVRGLRLAGLLLGVTDQEGDPDQEERLDLERGLALEVDLAITTVLLTLSFKQTMMTRSLIILIVMILENPVLRDC